MNIIEIARESGMLVLLDARIGREEYRGVSGSLDALERFAAAVRAETARGEGTRSARRAAATGRRS